MCPRHEFHQFPPLGKRPVARLVAASANSHDQLSFRMAAANARRFDCFGRAYMGSGENIMMQVKKLKIAQVLPELRLCSPSTTKTI
jgi:hypothetical protein